MAPMGLTNSLFKLARFSADVSAIASGKPRRIVRRAKNKAVGRLLARGGVWRRLWR
jgi:muconolactone delta-isomerase